MRSVPRRVTMSGLKQAFVTYVADSCVSALLIMQVVTWVQGRTLCRWKARMLLSVVVEGSTTTERSILAFHLQRVLPCTHVTTCMISSALTQLSATYVTNACFRPLIVTRRGTERIM